MVEETEASNRTALENRPGIFIVGSPNVGKRTLLSRLLSMDFEDGSDSSSQVLAHGWTIDTKYYTADVSIWMTHLHDEFSVRTLPIYNCLAALVMVFDLNDLSSLVALQDWVSRTDIQKFEILLCIGNKVDLIPDHPVHAEYRRRLQKLENPSSVPDVDLIPDHPVHAEYRRHLQKLEDPFSVPDTDFYEFGISETEGSSLLGGEDPAREIKRSCIEWCTEHNFEYIEACASNADFDKCLSVDGDSHGVERLFGALSAYMWPGMILKSGNSISQPALPNREDFSEEESDYEFEYEMLSAGSAEAWDETNGGWTSATSTSAVTDAGGSVDQNNHITEHDHVNWEKFDNQELEPSTSKVELPNDKEIVHNVEDPSRETETNEVTPFEFEDLEQLMSEIGNIRGNLRFMPGFQRREMAANLAIKMAVMFGGGIDDEEDFD